MPPTFNYSPANILAAQGELDEAMDQYRAALRVNPFYAGVYRNLEVILAKPGQLDDAIRHFRQALQFGLTSRTRMKAWEKLWLFNGTGKNQAGTIRKLCGS